jgi:hypothetical protein
MVLRTEKPQALYVALEKKNSRFYKLTSRRKGEKTTQNKTNTKNSKTQEARKA